VSVGGDGEETGSGENVLNNIFYNVGVWGDRFFKIGHDYDLNGLDDELQKNKSNYNIFLPKSGSDYMVADGGGTEYNTLSQWQTKYRFDLNSKEVNPQFINLNGGDYRPQAAETKAGANLTSYCTSLSIPELCKDKNGNARPTSGAWTIGAYEVGGGTPSDPDTTNPVVSITAPAFGTSVMAGTAVTITASASDPVISGQISSGVAGVQFKLDGSNLGAEDTAAPYASTWNTAGLSGTHTLTAVARDAAGHSVTSSSVTVTITAAPASQFSVNDRIRINQTGADVRVGAGATSAWLAARALGDLGTIVGGPTIVGASTWYQVNYNSGVDGWTNGQYFDYYYTVAISKPGAGTGTVTTGTGFACSGTTCSTTAPLGSVLTLTATPDSDATFAGWTVTPASSIDSGCTTGTACTLKDGASVTAVFNLTGGLANGAIRVKFVGADLDSVNLPASVVNSSVDSGPTYTTTSYRVFAPLTPATHILSFSNFPNYSVSYATCSYTVRTAECTVTDPAQYTTQNLTCSGTDCTLPVSVQANLFAKVVVRYLPSNLFKLTVITAGQGSITPTFTCLAQNCGGGTPLVCSGNRCDGTYPLGRVNLTFAPTQGWRLGAWYKNSNWAGNTLTDSFTLDKDTSVIGVFNSSLPPVLSSGFPQGTLPQGTKTVTLHVTSSLLSSCKFATEPNISYSQMSFSFETNADGTQTTHENPISDLEPGNYRYYVRCAASNGLVSDEYPILFSVAGAPPAPAPNEPVYQASAAPQVALTVPTEQVYADSDTPTLAATASDTTGVAEVTFYEQTGATVTRLGTVLTPPYTLKKKLAPGRHTIIAHVKDREGLFATSSPIVMNVTGSNRGAVTSAFVHTLSVGSRGEEVRQLQIFLNAQGFTVAQSGTGSVGKESSYFGPATKRALIKFQEAYRSEILAPFKLAKGTGIFGAATRAKANGMR
jgi:hypothetical protein